MANFSKPQSMMTVLVTIFALLQVAVAFQHGAHHHHAHPARSVDSAFEAHMNEIAGELEKRQSRGFIVVTGVCSSGIDNNGACRPGRASYPRLEIRQLQQNADQWNLYLIGMERFMARDKNDPLSYYQIAGIHGRPFVSWNNFPTPLVNQAGFCPHANILFGTWHRPYLALFEQAWYLAVQEAIDEFPSGQQQRWRNAAATLRIPYWDWAMDPGPGGATVPQSMRDTTVRVIEPSGPATIPNPLYSYTFGQSIPDEVGRGPWNSWPRTLRRPVSDPTRNNNNEMNARFNALRNSLTQRVYTLFASKQSWGDACTSAIGVRTELSGSGVDSFEGCHDAIHTTAGGESGGHMYYLDMSAFDPLFWVHHTNIDRLLAMYQLIVPNTYVSNGNINRPMAQWNPGEPKNAYTPLKPFAKDNEGHYWTSVDVKETRVLGYYYPETRDRSYQQVARAVTSLYGGGRRSLSKRTDDVTGQYLGRPFKKDDYHHVLSITANKFALDGSYTVHAFIGKPCNSTGKSTAPYPINNSTSPYPISNSTSPYSNNTSDADYDPSTDYTQNSNYVGSYGILGGMKAGGGNNSSSPVMTEGSLPLTNCLMGKEHYGELASLKPEDVEPYLAENLYYKVVGVNGELNPEDIPNFHVKVKCTKVTPATSDDELPDLSAPYQVLPDATNNLPAGKPFIYVPTAIDIALPNTPEYEEPGYNGGKPTSPSNGVFPYPSLPWEEEGYCVSKQTVHYVNPAGEFLYAEM
ncbi:Di-copper centre-containing protein [Plenodomus tracheiphilus IPT5]|uniref:tyrosinase n=1 Tax=Plenodomus tracheiphilus IPT5 TaxID=1408161 RepID=A0A6A7B1V5_9PLEO|nr:Di-copper centre-containing protein [Plenodomus tracheiphilus IPT5]